MEVKKRVYTKIGDVYCAEIDDSFKMYFQYIMDDTSQLTSPVVRVFKTKYPLYYDPVLEDIIRDEIVFYAHVVIRWGLNPT